MRYAIYNHIKPWHTYAEVWTRDCTITAASPAYEWAIGKDIGGLIEWANSNGRRWLCEGSETKPREDHERHSRKAPDGAVEIVNGRNRGA
jgi:hypothetical protein